MPELGLGIEIPKYANGEGGGTDVEVYDRILETGGPAIKRVIETGLEDRETEGAP